MTDEIFDSDAWCRALTVTERVRLISANHTGTSTAGHEMGARRLARWRSQYPFNIKRYYKMYLAENGFSETQFEQALAASDAELAAIVDEAPQWLQQLREAYVDPQSQPFEPPEGQDEIGFLNLIDPILERSLLRLWDKLEQLLAADADPPFDPETIQDVLLMNLPDLIIQRLGRTLVLELNVLRLQDGLSGDDARERFLDFLLKLRKPTYLRALFDEYPVLARQLNLSIRQWLEVSLECVERLCTDWQLLKEAFSDGEDPGKLVRLAGGAGDTHRRGRSVMIAEFESGMRVVYKPKSMAIDIHFQDLLDWLNEAGCQPPLRTLKTIDRVEYGWAEFVERAECRNESELRRFYRRQGIYLALLHVLASTDFHFENVIAAGEHPMLIDLETMIQPLFERYDESDGESLAQKHMAESVLSIGLLPMRIWSFGEEYNGIDISGLGGAAGQLSPDRIPNIADLGTDQMRYVRERVEIEGDANRPVLDGVEANAVDYIDDIVLGFEQMYRLVMQHRRELLRPGGLLDAFAQDAIRVLMRPTRTYGQLLYESFHPDMLRDQVDRDLFLERLWLVVPERNHMKEILAAEREDLLAGDIPVFTSKPDSLNLFDAMDRPISGVLTVRGLDNVRQQIENMSEEDLQRQAWYIRASIATVAPERTVFEPVGRVTEVPTVLRSSRLLDAARDAADYLCAIAHEGDDDVAWVGLQGEAERYWAISTLGLDLYGGAPGIALFLAYAGEILQENRYRDLARKAYSTIQMQSEMAADEWSALGGYEGWGGVLQYFTRLGMIWQDEEVFLQAERVANRIWGYVEENRIYDVVRGTAGALQALLGLYSMRPSSTVLRVANLCGDHIVDAAESQSIGVGWPTTRYGDTALTGYAHGASGVAAALMGLYRVSGEPKYRQVAMEALHFERNMFNPVIGSWPDNRRETSYDSPRAFEGEEHFAAWCRGSVGIGLARTQMIQSVDSSDSDDMYADLESAVITTLNHGFGHSHCLCHGDLGSLDFLYQASDLVPSTVSTGELARLTSASLDNVLRQRWRCGGPEGVEMPGLMLGVAGIGYQMLRLAEPDVVSSVLVPIGAGDSFEVLNVSRRAEKQLA
jgi:type 2 lantibiotic biosynthesis protein LanM